MVNRNQGHHLPLLDKHSCSWSVDSCWTSMAHRKDSAMDEDDSNLKWSWKVYPIGPYPRKSTALRRIWTLCLDFLRCWFQVSESTTASGQSSIQIKGVDNSSVIMWLRRSHPSDELPLANLWRVRMAPISFKWVTHLNKAITHEYDI